MGRPKRGDDTGRLRLLDATVALLETTPEALIRLETVVAKAGVTVPLVTHHFGSREQLIGEAQCQRFAALVTRDITRVRRFLSHTDSVATFRGGLRQLVALRLKESRNSFVVAGLIGATHARTDLARQFTAHYARLTAAYTQVILDAQQASIVAEEVDVRSVANVITAVLYGLSVTMLDADVAETDRIADTATDMLSATLKLPAA